MIPDTVQTEYVQEPVSTSRKGKTQIIETHIYEEISKIEGNEIIKLVNMEHILSMREEDVLNVILHLRSMAGGPTAALTTAKAHQLCSGSLEHCLGQEEFKV